MGPLSRFVIFTTAIRTRRSIITKVKMIGRFLRFMIFEMGVSFRERASIFEIGANFIMVNQSKMDGI